MSTTRKRSRRKNNEGSWGTKTIKGVKYKYFRKKYEGKMKYFYGKTDAEIREKIKAFENKNMIITPKEISKQAFGTYISNWLENVKQPEVKRRTYDTYEDIVNAQIKKYRDYDIAGKQMGSLTEDMFRIYYNSMAKVYARGTIKRNYALVKQCIKYAEKRGDLKKGFFDDMAIPSEDFVKVKKKKIEILTEEDMNKLYNESKRINTQGYKFNGRIGTPVYGNNAHAIIFILYTGLRIGEVMALKWKDVDIKSKCIYINSSVSTIKNRDIKSKNDNKYIEEITTTKTEDSNRVVPLADRAIEVLDLLISQNPNYEPKDRVFTNKNGGTLNKSNVRRTLETMLTRADCSIKKCGLHALRHTFASYLILKDVDIKIVSEILGHSDTSITYNIYVHIIKQQKIDAISVLDKINKKKTM